MDHQGEGRIEAVRRAQAGLRGVDLHKAAVHTGLEIQANGAVRVALLGRALHVQPDSLEITAEDARRVSPVEALLVLRYVAADREIRPTGEDVPFRDLPGGTFYAAAMAKRTTDQLVKRFINNAESLTHALQAFPHEPMPIGEVSARVHAIGRIHLVLIYRFGDDEFPPAADLLFDRSIASVYTLDEVAALATAFTFGLIRAAGYPGA